KKLNVSQSTVAMWETGRRDPSTDDILKISKLFSVSSDYLLGSTNILNNDHSKTSEFLEDFPEGVDVLRRSTQELSPEAREVMIKHMNQFIDDIKKLEKDK